MELLTYLKLTLTTDMHSSTVNTFQCDLQAIHHVKIQLDKGTTRISHQMVVGRVYYTKKV
jgi:hypothetical protein